MLTSLTATPLSMIARMAAGVRVMRKMCCLGLALPMMSMVFCTEKKRMPTPAASVVIFMSDCCRGSAAASSSATTTRFALAAPTHEDPT